MFKVPRPKQQQSTTSTWTSYWLDVCARHLRGTHRCVQITWGGHPKDKTPDAKICGLVYQVECPECLLPYIGETGRTLATRMKDHLNLRNPLTAVGEHCAHDHHKIIQRTTLEYYLEKIFG